MKKKNILARLNGIHRRLAIKPTTFLIDLEKHLQKDLENILNHEMDLWAMKSRINWLIQGERNTTFYHITTLDWRKRNRIDAIQNNSGKWIREERDIMSFIRQGFKELFMTTKTLSHYIGCPPSRWHTFLSDPDRICLSCPISNEEIKATLWSMKAFKEPGPDGLHAGFFQHFGLQLVPQ